MYRVCRAKQMREIDKRAAEEYKIPGIVLMENAAMRCVEELLSVFKTVEGLKVGVFCGKGNNGGDGFAIARHLERLGAGVDVFPVCGYAFSADAEANFSMLESTGCKIKDTDRAYFEMPSYDIVIDALLGTGISGTVSGELYDIIEEINKNGKYVLSVDIPSGINSDTGEVCAICVHADMTVTLAAYKPGLVLYPGADFCGNIKCADICIPKKAFADIDKFIADEKFVKDNFPKRENNSQKGDYGKVLVIAGSVGLSGAAALSANSAVVSGSGLVTLACPEEINAVLEQKTTEAMTVPLKSEKGHLSRECLPQLLNMISGFDGILFGPGLGRSEDIACILREIAKKSSVPLIIDADGLYALAGDMSILEECNCEVILTPHEMEMSRLCGESLNFVASNRIEVSERFAEENGVTVILKGSKTVVTSVGGSQYINVRGNSGMATGGSGDVLAGILISLAARGISEEAAAVCAVFVHAVAGDKARDKFGEDGVTACRIIDSISEAICGII